MPSGGDGLLDVDLIALEHEGWEALVAGQAAAYYGEHLAANAVMAFPFGVMEREEAIASMAAAPPWETFSISGARVVALTADSGVVVYRVVAQRPGQPPYAAVVSSTFSRVDGEWRLAFHQQSPAA
jgi:hypothetical protein